MVNPDYLYDPEAAKPYFAKNYFIDKKLSFQVIENGTILPHTIMPERGNGFWSKNLGGIANIKGEFIKESYVHCGVGDIYTPPRINSKKHQYRNLSGILLSGLGARYNG